MSKKATYGAGGTTKVVGSLRDRKALDFFARFPLSHEETIEKLLFQSCVLSLVVTKIPYSDLIRIRANSNGSNIA